MTQLSTNFGPYGEATVFLELPEDVGRRLLSLCLHPEGYSISPLPDLFRSLDAGDDWSSLWPRVPGVALLAVGRTSPHAATLAPGVARAPERWGVELFVHPTAEGTDSLDALDYTRDATALDLDTRLAVAAALRPLLDLVGGPVRV